MDTNELTDRLVFLAMRALGNRGKRTRFKDINTCEDLYAKDSTAEERSAYRIVWAKLIGLIDTRWAYSMKQRSMIAHSQASFTVTPYILFSKILGHAPSRQEWVDLVGRVSEWLMLMSFLTFKNKHDEQTSIDGLAAEFLRFMYTAFCFTLINHWKELLHDEKAAKKVLSLNEPVHIDTASGSKDTKEERGDRIESDAYDPHEGFLIINPGKPEGSFTLYIPDYPLKELNEAFIYCLSEKQQKIIEMHLQYVTQYLEVPEGMNLSKYIAQTLGISLDAYFVQMTRIRKALRNYVEENAAKNSQ